MPAASPSGRPQSTARKLFLVLAILLVLAAVERFWGFVQSRDLPTGPAQWIWADIEPDRQRPSEALALYALRDFAIDEVPASARLRIMVDEEYQVFLNGRRVGSGRLEADDALDEYEVAQVLVRGPNRLVIEARSRFRYGGILASIEIQGPVADGQKQWLVVSDDSWQIVTEHQQGLLEGFTAPRSWHSAKSWRRPPVGRWPMPREPSSPPVAVSDRQPLPISVSDIQSVEVTYLPRIVAGFASLVSVSSRDQDSREDEDLPKSRLGYLLDFGEVVEGHLELWAQGQQPRLTQSLPRIRFEEQPPSLEVSSSGETDHVSTHMVFVQQRPLWRDVEPRRFRYALVSDSVPIVFAQVSPVVGGVR